MNNILITGGLGFIGSNFINYLLSIDKYSKVINLDANTYAASELEICSQNKERYAYVEGDINNKELVEAIFREQNITSVINFAAETHVDNSIKNPAIFIQTNINGTFNLLEQAYKHWMNAPGEYKCDYCDNDKPQIGRFMHISTDEVFGTTDAPDGFSETSPYLPNSPYSSSKASSDLLVRSYNKTFGLNTVITNCSNNYGPGQNVEKLIPSIINSALSLKPITIYGDGKNIRDWLYVEDHCEAIYEVFLRANAGQRYNIGGNNELENNYVVSEVCNILNKAVPLKDKRISSYNDLITYVKDREGHDRRYSVNTSKVSKELNWQPKTRFLAGLEKTVLWYLNR